MTSEARDIVERLRERKAFGLNGATWVMLTVPDPDCQEAAEEIRRLREALEGAIGSIEFWGGYASDYFKDKHDFQADLDKARQALSPTGD